MLYVILCLPSVIYSYHIFKSVTEDRAQAVVLAVCNLFVSAGFVSGLGGI